MMITVEKDIGITQDAGNTPVKRKQGTKHKMIAYETTELPISADAPNAETMKALDEMNSGECVRFSSLESLFKDLES